MKVDLFKRADIIRFSVLSQTSAEQSYLTMNFPEKKPTVSGRINIPVSRNSYMFLKQFKLNISDNALPYFEKMKEAQDKSLSARELREASYIRHVQSFIDSGFSKKEDLPRDFTPNLSPLSHQQVALNYMIDCLGVCDSHALFFDMGTGKTYTALNWAEYLIEKGLVKTVLVIAPLYTLKSAWTNDISKFCNLTSQVIYSYKSGSKYREKEIVAQIKEKKHIYITNYSTILSDKWRSIIEENASFDMIILDESSHIKNPKSKTFKNIMALSEKSKYNLVLNGTPAPQGLLDLWSQFYFLDRGLTLGESFREYEDTYFNRHPKNIYMKFPKPNANAMVHERIRYTSLIFKKEDILDLPSRQHILRICQLDNKARAVYTSIEKEGIALLSQGQEDVVLETSNILTKIQKLRQITGGFVYIEDDNLVRSVKEFKTEKNEIALGIIEEAIATSDDKVIVWATYKHEMERISKILTSKKIFHAGCFGGIGGKKTQENLDIFQNDPTCKVLIASRGSVGTGVNLQHANINIYFSLDEDLQNYLQSLDRTYRHGQKKKVLNYYLVCRETYDERLVSLLRYKQSVQDFLLRGRLNEEQMRNSNLINEWKIEDF